jgi:signal transduction histidine kinase
MDVNPQNNHRILIIDDNRSIHDDFRKILGASNELPNKLGALEGTLFGGETSRPEMPVFQIDSAFQGQEGLDLIERSLQENNPYAMAFVDVRMPPGWDGVETTARIWQKYTDLQVVICTAYSDYSWEEMLKRLGYSDRLVILKKPFDNIEVSQLAISLTEKWRLYQQARLRLEDLEKMVHDRTLVLESTNFKLGDANHQLMLATEKAQEMAEAALVASKTKSAFLANMSHEIRTPMNGVIGMIHLLLESELTPDQHECCDVIKTSAEALLCIINDILDFSKIEAGKLSFETVEFDLDETVKGAIDLLAQRAREKGLNLTHQIAPGTHARLVGDPTRVRQVLLNLLSNAVKFTHTGGISLEIAPLSETDSQIELQFTVTDTGIGISEAAQQQLFQSFTQADSSTMRRFGGTGLGLAISRRLAELMGGTILLTSSLKKGSTFRFTGKFGKQPAARVPSTETATSGAAPAGTPAVSEHHPPAAPPAASKARVLLAEDNPVNQLVAVKQLNKLGYEADVVANGIEAVEAYGQRPYRIIFMDCQMPEMDGYAAVRKIRELEAERTLSPARLIAMTAHAMQGDKELCLATGMNDYLAKPVDMEHLRAALQAAEEAASVPTPRPLSPPQPADCPK